MNLTPDEKTKRVSVAQIGGDSLSKLVIKPTRKLGENAHIRRSPRKSYFSFFHVESKNLDARWNLRGIPSVRDVPDGGRFSDNIHVARALWKREESFDQDFMMPTRVREVLESEGLKDDVINNAISRDEKKYRKINLQMTEESRLKVKLNSERTHEQLPARPTEQRMSFSTFGASPFVNGGRGDKDGKWKEWRPMASSPSYKQAPCIAEPINIGKEFHSSFDSVQMDFDQSEIDRAMWKSDQHAEKLFGGKNFVPPRLVLISSKVTKCHLLSKVLLDENVIHIIYDFETWTFSDLIDAVAQRLDRHRRRCKAKSIMILCQGGPGYIYLLRNYVITPQKLTKPSYRGVVEFWKNLGNQISKIDSSEAAIHIFGFQLSGTDQGTKLVSMLQSLMYPNMVKIVASNDDTEDGKLTAGLYFKYSRYKVWKMHQNTSVADIDFSAAEDHTEKRDDDIVTVRTKLET